MEEYPVLLLDHALLELDIKRQNFLINALQDVQTIIIGTNINEVKDYHFKIRNILSNRRNCRKIE